MSSRRFFENLHYRPLPFWLWPLLPLSWTYGSICGVRLWFYQIKLLKSIEVAPPVISIGNLTTGGTGKTPVVIALAKYLVQCNKKVVILSRGYGAKKPQRYARATHPEFGDEAYLLQQSVPEAIVIVGKNRAENAAIATNEFQPDVILLDDGYQYVKLTRQINILLVDASLGFGNEQLLPLGPLRETLNALKRATHIVLTKNADNHRLSHLHHTLQQHAVPGAISLPPMHWPFKAAGFYCPENPDQSIDTNLVAQKKLSSICGIARPEGFINSLCELGISILQPNQFIFSDHHNYTVDDLKPAFQQNPDLLLTTDKDWVKLQQIIPKEQWCKFLCLRIKPEIETYHWQSILGDIFPELQLPIETKELIS